MKITVLGGRLCFAQHLFTASKPPTAAADADLKFQGKIIVERDSEAAKIVKAAVEAEAKREWGEKWQDVLKAVQAAGNIWVLRDGDLEERPEYKGKLTVNAKNKIRPLTLGAGPDGRSAVTEQDGKLYSGCYVNMILDVKAGSKPKKQVYAYLLAVQFVKDGERLGGGLTAAADDFAPIPQEAVAQAAATGAGASGLF